MIQIFKKNIFLIIITLITLIVVNSFIYINKHFFKTEAKIKINLSQKNNYDSYNATRYLKKLRVNKDIYNSVVKDINLKYFSSRKDFQFYKSNIVYNSSKLEFLKYQNKSFLYKKFDKNQYAVFVKENFKTIFNNKIENLRKNFIIDKKKTINKCLINTSIYNFQNPKENFIELQNKFNEVYENLYLEYITIDEIEKKIGIPNPLIFYCIRDNSYTDYYYLANFSNFSKNINLDIEINFKNYENKKLIYFLNLIIITTFTLVNFSFTIIKNLRRNYQ